MQKMRGVGQNMGSRLQPFPRRCFLKWRKLLRRKQQITTMKKTIMLAAVIGFAAAMTACASDGKAIWDQQCAKCHGADGTGQTNIGKRLGCKDYSDPKVQDALTDDAAIKAVKEGVKDSNGKTVMRGNDNISNDDAKAVVAYLRTLKK
jgi:mono/diheme cytochrome c family protein